MKYDSKKYEAVGNFVLCKQLIKPEKSEAGLHLPPSARKDAFALVISVGSECKKGIEKGDLIAYHRATQVMIDGNEFAAVNEFLILGRIPKSAVSMTEQEMAVL